MNYATTQRADILADRFGFKVAGRLAAEQNELPYDISERLRAARERAIAKRKASVVTTAESTVQMGSVAALTWGKSEGLSFWNGLASVLPVVALVLGLMAIKTVQDDTRVSELAAVDMALLTDELPPQAFTDPGFAQFLKHQQ
jgi:hypothetical protein